MNINKMFSFQICDPDKILPPIERHAVDLEMHRIAVATSDTNVLTDQCKMKGWIYLHKIVNYNLLKLIAYCAANS
jgi:hypothetical protein